MLNLKLTPYLKLYTIKGDIYVSNGIQTEMLVLKIYPNVEVEALNILDELGYELIEKTEEKNIFTRKKEVSFLMRKNNKRQNYCKEHSEGENQE